MNTKLIKKILNPLFILTLILNLGFLPAKTYALAPQTQITKLFNTLDSLPADQLRQLFFEKQLSFNQLFKILQDKLGQISPIELLNKLNYEIGNKKIIPILNDKLQITFQISNNDHDKKHIFWLFIPHQALNNNIHAEGFRTNPASKGTMIGVYADTLKKNPFLKNYQIPTQENIFSYVNTYKLIETNQKIFSHRKNKTNDLTTFKKIAELLLQIEEEKTDDPTIIKNINNVFQMAYNLAQEEANITSIMAALFYYDNLIKAMADHLSIKPQKVIQHFTNYYDSKLIEEKIKKAKTILNYPFKPDPTAKHSFPNFLYSLIQQANLNSKEDTVFGKAELDILLLALFSKIEEINQEPTDDFQKEEQLSVLNTYGPLVEMLDKNNISDQLRNIYFHYNHAKEYTALTTALYNVFGMSYTELQNHLEYNVMSRLKKCLTPLENQYHLTFRYRVKSLYSLWEKISSKHTFNQDEDIVSTIENVLREGILLKDGKESKLDDLYGIQVIFDIAQSLRDEDHMNIIQKEILDIIESEFQEDQAAKTFLRKKKTLSKYGYHEEKIMPIWKDKKGTKYRAEIQVLSDKDLTLYKHGATDTDIKAHWGFKIRDKGYIFDEEILNLIKKLQYQYTDDSHKNFKILFDYLKRYMFTAVYIEGTKDQSRHLQYLRLPPGSIIADAASTNSVDQLLEYNYASILITKNENGEIIIKNDKFVLPWKQIHAGKIFQFRRAKPNMESFATARDRIIQDAKKINTVVQLFTQEISTQEIETAKKQLEEHIKNILQKFSLNTDMETLIQKIKQTSLLLFHLDEENELFKLTHIIDTETNNRTILKLSNHFFQKTFDLPTNFSNLNMIYNFLQIPQKNQSPLFLLATYMAAEQIGKEKLTNQYKTSLEDKKDFDDISNIPIKYALKQTAKRYKTNYLHQLYTLIGLNELSTYEIIFDLYHQNFSYRLNIDAKNKAIDIYKLFIELEKAGLEHLSSVTIDNNILTINIISPSLTTNTQEKLLITTKLQTILPKFNITNYELHPSRQTPKKSIKIITKNEQTRNIIKIMLENLEIPVETTEQGELIAKISQRMPITIMNNLLKDNLNIPLEQKADFEIINLDKTISFKASYQILQAA